MRRRHDDGQAPPGWMKSRASGEGRELFERRSAWPTGRYKQLVCVRALRASARLGRTAMPPVTPKADCAKSKTPPQIFMPFPHEESRSLHAPHKSGTSDAVECGACGGFALFARFISIRLVPTPGPIKSEVGVVLGLPDRGVAVTEQ